MSAAYAGFFPRFPYFIRYVCLIFFWFWVLGLGLGLRSPLVYFPYKVNFLAYPVPTCCPIFRRNDTQHCAFVVGVPLHLRGVPSLMLGRSGSNSLACVFRKKDYRGTRQPAAPASPGRPPPGGRGRRPAGVCVHREGHGAQDRPGLRARPHRAQPCPPPGESRA